MKGGASCIIYFCISKMKFLRSTRGREMQHVENLLPFLFESFFTKVDASKMHYLYKTLFVNLKLHVFPYFILLFIIWIICWHAHEYIKMFLCNFIHVSKYTESINLEKFCFLRFNVWSNYIFPGLYETYHGKYFIPLLSIKINMSL